VAPANKSFFIDVTVKPAPHFGAALTATLLPVSVWAAKNVKPPSVEVIILLGLMSV